MVNFRSNYHNTHIVIGIGVMVVGAEMSCIPVVGVLVCIAGLIMTLVE